jgi:hypothetical protein
MRAVIRANARPGGTRVSHVWRTRPRDRQLFSQQCTKGKSYLEESLFRRDAETNTRDTRVTRILSLTRRKIPDSVIGRADGDEIPIVARL